MIKNNIKILISILGFLLFLPAICFGNKENPRYISLAPSTTEILFALGLDQEIVGVSSFCDYPPQVSSKEKVGTFSQPNLEKIISLQPDYIFCTGLEQDAAVAELKRAGFAVYVADPSTIEELLSSIEEIGVITLLQEKAHQIALSMKDNLEVLRAKTSAIPESSRPKVFLEIWPDPLTTAGNGSFVDQIISCAGGKNIASNLRRAYSIFSAEEVINSMPDCIILAYMDKGANVKSLFLRRGWERIPAIKNNRVYNDIDPNIILRPGPRIVEGAFELNNRFYK
ncbi:MAG: cobalamin-binding protein [Candidatus Omnitrophica bacterium]|jgi:iron complex transport system substrate-binding protein|nr:cobalamin-binding protein [Candidatus Omnitrophota bacterium]